MAIIEWEGLKDTFIYVGSINICSKNRKECDQNYSRLREVADKYGFTFTEKKSVLAVEDLQLLGYKSKYNEIWPDPEKVQPLRKLKESISLAAQKRIVGYFATASGSETIQIKS